MHRGGAAREFAEYLERKLATIRAAGRDDLVLVMYEGLATGEAGEEVRERIERAAGPVLWFVKRPRIGPVMEAVVAVARPVAAT